MTASGEHEDGELALADPSLFIAVEQDRRRSSHSPGRVAVSAGTVGKLRLGVLAAHDGPTRARRLDALSVAAALDPLPIDEVVTHAWAILRLALRDAGKRHPGRSLFQPAPSRYLLLPSRYAHDLASASGSGH